MNKSTNVFLVAQSMELMISKLENVFAIDIGLDQIARKVKLSINFGNNLSEKLLCFSVVQSGMRTSWKV